MNAFRNGYGSDTMTAPDGRVSRVREGDLTTREDAERDLARRTAEFAATAPGRWAMRGRAIRPAKASLTSVSYNYGSLPASVAAAARAAPAAGTSRESPTPSGPPGDNNSTNAGRRQSEADNIQAGAATALAAEKDAAQALRNELAGGNAEQKAAAENARLAAAGMGDEVVAAQRVLAAAQATAAAANSRRAQEEAGLRVSQAQAALRQAEEARLRASVALKTAGSDNTDADAAKARIAMIDQLLAKEQDGLDPVARPPAREEGHRACAGARRRRRGRGDRDTGLHAAAADAPGAACRHQGRGPRPRPVLPGAVGLTQQVNTELEALEIGHNDRLQKIREGDTARLRQLAQERIQIEAQASSRRQRAVIESNRAEVQETANSYRQIGSTITGNAFSVIRGQQSIAQAAQSTAMSLIESYAQAKVKMLADTLAGVTVHQAAETAKTGSTVAGSTARAAADTASTVASETQQTAAKAAGVGARTSIDVAGAATAGAAKVGAMFTSIMASAAETFAGVFGFLSPVMARQLPGLPWPRRRPSRPLPPHCPRSLSARGASLATCSPTSTRAKWSHLPRRRRTCGRSSGHAPVADGWRGWGAEHQPDAQRERPDDQHRDPPARRDHRRRGAADLERQPGQAAGILRRAP